MNSVTVDRYFPFPVAKVWQRYTDHEGWSDWAGLGRVRLLREGAPERNGVGAVRSFSSSPGLREEVVAFDAPRVMHYRVTAGPMPFDRHLGQVVFASEGDGTRLTWRVSFRCRVPGLGWVMERGLTLLFGRMLAALDGDLARRPS